MEKLGIAASISERGPRCPTERLHRYPFPAGGGYNGVAIGLQQFSWLTRKYGLIKKVILNLSIAPSNQKKTVCKSCSFLEREAELASKMEEIRAHSKNEYNRCIF